MSYEDGYQFNLSGAAGDLQSALDNSFLGKFLNKYATVQGMSELVEKAGSKIENAYQSAKSSISNGLDRGKEALGLKAQETPEVAQEPKLGRSAVALKLQQESNGVGSHGREGPSVETFQSINGMDGLVKANGVGGDVANDNLSQIRVSNMNYSAADIGTSITAIGSGTAMSASMAAQRQNQEMALA